MRTAVKLMVITCAGLLLSAPVMAWDASRGQQLSETCAACHGADGKSLVPIFPNLGGQHRDYLYRALLDYKLGNRQDPIMSPQVAELSRKDLRDLAAFYASQEGLHLVR